MIGRPILESECDIGNQSLAVLRYPVSVLIKINRDMGRVQEIQPIMIPNQPTRGINRGNKLGDLIGTAISILVPQP